MSTGWSLFGLSRARAEAWRKVSESLGAEYHDGGLFAKGKVQWATGDWTITLDTFSTDNATFTRMRAPFANLDGFRFRITRRSIFSWLGRLLKLQDVEVGHASFDQDFVVRGNSVVRLKRLLGNDRIRLLMLRQKRCDFRVLDRDGWFGAKFPPGLDQLHFQAGGVIKDVHRLEGLFELFAESLRQLSWEGLARPVGVETHIARLRGPGGQVEGGGVRWEGDRVRREAAEALGELADSRAVPALLDALGGRDGYDHGLRARAIDALGAIGDRRAVGPLVALLGNVEPVGGRTVQERAAGALRRMGEETLSVAVLSALAGDRNGLAEAAKRCREEVVAACVAALSGTAPVHAAAALESLRATEALPGMRAALRLYGLRSPAGAAIHSAILGLEAHASLPRAADPGRLAPETLPRSASDAPPPSESLPRGADAADG